MRADGTILGRKFINFPSNKDHLYHVTWQNPPFSERTFLQTGSKSMGLCKKAEYGAVPQNSCGNHEICRRISGRCNCVRISGNAGENIRKKKQKLHLWRKRDIQKLCEHQAHRNGIHVSRVSARNTSRLACDGSGAVVRNPENHSLCTFRTGKQYNCDLSAAYNIGARYFIRELLKPFAGNGKVFTGGKKSLQ